MAMESKKGKRFSRRVRTWKRLLAVAICAIIMVTTCMASMPAFASDQKVYCGLEEHTHDKSCYEEQLTCEKEENDSHSHTEDCYKKVLTCGKQEHEHTKECYKNSESSEENKGTSEKTTSEESQKESPEEEVATEEENLLAEDSKAAESSDANVASEEADSSVDAATIAAIDEKLGLKNYVIQDSKNSKTVDLSLEGDEFNKRFYYGNAAKDSRVPFNDAESYKEYLAQCYENDLANGTDTLTSEWNKYLYDLFDPTYDMGNMGNTQASEKDKKGCDYPDATTSNGYGDPAPYINWPKDGGTGPFHAISDKVLNPKLNALDYDKKEGSVDYSNLIRDFNKTVTAHKSGDENKERKYDVELSAKVQGTTSAPVCMVLQIQTSWQMFDLSHANCVKGDGNYASIEVGGCANNTQIATLYDIKQALIRLVKDLNDKYPGNNLALAVTDVEHGGTWSMLGPVGGKDSKNGQFVSNDEETLLEGLYGWDTFGNCEHVHYKSDALENAVKNLKSNMSEWTDGSGNDVSYEDVRKVAVILGGATENTDGENGYGITLPWKTFQSAGLNSVYGIRTNEGTANATSDKDADHPISWIDYSENNTGTAFKDGTGSSFTGKYVATTEDAVYNTLLQIAEQEMNESPILINVEDIYAEDVVVTDTIQDEFELDTSEPMKAIIQNASGETEKEIEVSLDDLSTETLDDGSIQMTSKDGKLTIVKNTDGTTKVTYNFGDVQNTRTMKLDFGIQAKEDYIGSNNVWSNVGKPDISYEHTPADSSKETESYEVECSKTPEVNVPIQFTSTDGEETSILVGENTDLKDLSSEIVKDAEEKVQAYDQINGVLSYEWLLPDGTKVDAGSVSVSNGSIGDVSFPDRSYTFEGTAEGDYEITLNVTFTPNEVEDKGNYSNNTTKTAVNALTNPGIVTVHVLDADSTKDLIIRKDWIGGDPSEGQEITYKLLADGEEVRTGILSSKNNWKETQKDLPLVNKEKKEIINYTVEEVTEVPGFTTSYSTDIQTESDTTYAASLQLKVSFEKDIEAKKYIEYTFMYGDQTYTYVETANSHDKYLKYEEGNSKKQYIYTINLPKFYEVDEDNNVKDVKLVSVSIYELDDRGERKNSETLKFTDRGSVATRIISGESSESTDVLVIKNTSNGVVNLSIHKTNENGKISLEGAEFQLLASDGSLVTSGSTNANGDFELNGLLKGTKYQLKETKAPNGYTIEENPWDIEISAEGTISVTQNGKTVECSDGTLQITNTAFYELPNAGGIGTLPFTLVGTILISLAVILILDRYRKTHLL